MCRVREQGAAVLLLLITVGMTAGASLAMKNAAVQVTQQRSASRSARLANTALELKRAKDALIAYAVTYADNYPASGAGVGHLPCPDRDPIADGILTNDGPDPPCRADADNVGRLPRYTFSRDFESNRTRQKLIEFYPPRSLMDEQMWYVVSKTFINNPINTIVNPATRGELSVDGVDNIVAVVVAPGPALMGQAQARPGDNIRDYLEGENADNDSDFTQQFSIDGNDQLVYIRASEVMQFAVRRVAGFVVAWLQQYRRDNCRNLPADCYPANLSPDRLTADGMLDQTALQGHWFVRNEWWRFLNYYRDPRCQLDVESECEIVTGIVTDSALQSIDIIIKPRKGAG